MRVRTLLATMTVAVTACGARESVDAASGHDLPAECAPPLPPACTTMAPRATPVERFLRDTAIPLRCGADVWDLRPVIDLFGDKRVFMLGELHGANEIGIVSALLFEQLAVEGRVNRLGYELPMDMESKLQQWIDTGHEETIDRVLPFYAPNSFGRILTDRARVLAAGGVPIAVAAVDIPSDPGFAVEALQRLATKLANQRDTVLATLPTSRAVPPAPADFARADAYFDRITRERAAICAELSTDDCEELVAMTHALWASTFAYDSRDDMPRWTSRREEVIYYNLKSKLRSPTDRIFVHMGAAHANKDRFSSAGRLDHDYPLTKGQVFSIGPAYGSGSVVFYGRDIAVDGVPRPLTSTLGDAPEHPLFVSTTRPSATCETNPFGLEVAEIGTGIRAATYDGYLHYGRLTSEKDPAATRLAIDTHVIGLSLEDRRQSERR